eukprot:410138-Amphidinium_carterae.1
MRTHQIANLSSRPPRNAHIHTHTQETFQHAINVEHTAQLQVAPLHPAIALINPGSNVSHNLV